MREQDDLWLDEVWAAWLARQARPGICRLNEERRRLIRNALADYTSDQLRALIAWVYEADEPGPRWLRGDNPDRRAYTDLGALLRPSKIAARVEAAVAWSERPTGPNPEASEPQRDPEGVDVDRMVALSRRVPGRRVLGGFDA